MRHNTNLGILLLCLLLGFSVGAPANLLYATGTILIFILIRWFFFDKQPLSNGTWWFVQVISPAILIIYLIRSYSAVG